jgi:3-keto-disaccharide hydrolase
MKRLSATAAGLLVAGLAACATMSGSGWETLVDGSKGLDNFSPIGEANWRTEDGAIVADKGNGGYLVSKSVYKDFQIRAEFWADHNTNSGIFLRCGDPKKVGAATCYEVNIYDQRPGPEYGTGGIVDVAKVQPIYKAGGKWNTYEITAKGSQLTVVFNGTKTVDVQDRKHAQGPIALQFGNHGKQPGGAIKWRKVEIRSL